MLSTSNEKWRCAALALLACVLPAERVRSEEGCRRGGAADELEALIEDLPEAFDTLAGRIAIQERLVAIAEQERSELRMAALQELEASAQDESFDRRRDERSQAVAQVKTAFVVIAEELRGHSAMENDVRAFLGREDAADLVFDTCFGREREGDPVRFVLDHTRLGRALHRAGDGSWWLNPHALWDLDVLLQTLLEYAQTRRPLLEVSDELELVRRAIEEAGRVEIDPVARFRERHLAGNGRQADLEGLQARLRQIQRELEWSGARCVLAVDGLEYDGSGLDLLRSSIFFNPRTLTGYRSYTTEFPDHHTARLFGTWGWNAKVSRDEEDLVARLRQRGEHLRQLAHSHDKLIIHISGVPPWLSSHAGEGEFEGGGWEDKQAHPPRDMQTWKRLIAELARVFREVEGVDRYYEFWNEPDIEFWQGSLGDFLELYAVTARTIREIDPAGKIGGCAPNQWDGRIDKQAGSDILNLELMRYAREHDLPLDFVSWHHFGRPLEAIAEARAAYLAQWRETGLPGEPEWLVTEWSSPYRGTPHANAPFAELMLAFRAAGLDAQTASCWEEFHAKPDPRGFAPWGLMTQQGQRSNRWFVHRFFDRLARGSQGIAILRPTEELTLVVSRKADDVYDLMLWGLGSVPRQAAAWELLQEQGFDREQAAQAYRVGDRLARAIAAGESPSAEWAEAFAAAQAVHDSHPVETRRLVLDFEGVRAIEILACEAVRMQHDPSRAAVVQGNSVACAVSSHEVLRLLLRISR